MSAVVDLPEAVRTYVRPGMTVALEGFSHVVPFAAGHEVIRQRISDLTLVRMVPDLLTDQMIGMGLVSTLVFSWAGNPGVGSLPRFRDAVEHDWPRPLNLVEHSHAQLANRFVAGASRVPFAVMRGEQRDDLSARSTHLEHMECPFTGERVSVVPAINPDTTIIHAQFADRRGNVCVQGVTGVNREAVFAAKNTIATVEAIVDELPPGQLWIPARLISAVAIAERGAKPSYSLGAPYARDDDFYRTWPEVSRDRERFLTWMEQHVTRANATVGSE